MHGHAIDRCVGLETEKTMNGIARQWGMVGHSGDGDRK